MWSHDRPKDFIFLHEHFSSWVAGLKEMMEASLWSFYGGWIFELEWGLSMVIFHHGDAAEDKGKEV